MSIKQTLIYGIIGLVFNLLKYGVNIFRIFKYSSVTLIEKILISAMVLIPIYASFELLYYHIKNIVSTIVSFSKSILYELIVIGFDVSKLSVLGLEITAICTLSLMHLPKLYDSINMIIYGVSGRYYYRDVKWYGIKYYKS